MRRTRIEKDFDYYIGEYMFFCQSRQLRPKTMRAYEQALRLFERWCAEEANIKDVSLITEATLRHYICDLQERGKYTFYSIEGRENTNYPERRRDYNQPVSTTTINNYIRCLKPFFYWYAEEKGVDSPMRRIKELKNERTPARGRWASAGTGKRRRRKG